MVGEGGEGEVAGADADADEVVGVFGGAGGGWALVTGGAFRGRAGVA